MQKIKVVLCGEKAVAEHCLAFLANRRDTEVCAIVTAPKDWQADLISWGTKRRIKVFVGNINDYLDELTQMKLDFVISVQYRPLLKSPILNLPRLGCINLHFGLLPKYGGCYPIAWSILNNEKEAGATLHYMVENFDEGNIISQTSVPISPNTTARSLFDAVSEAAFHLFAETYPKLCRGEADSQPQDLSMKLYYGADSIDFERDSVVCWENEPAEIQTQIRAFTFEPFQLPNAFLLLPGGERRKVTMAESRLRDLDSKALLKGPGQVVSVNPSGTLTIATGGRQAIDIGLLDGQNPRDFLVSLGTSPQGAVFL